MLPTRIAAVLRDDPRLIIPVGTLERHGEHLPLGCDTIIVERMAAALSAEYGVLLAPTVEYGVNPETDDEFPGNASVRKKTLHRTLNDLLSAWEKNGVREFILLTAHRYDAHEEALATVTTLTARVRVVDILAVNLSDLLQGQTEAMHGDEVDTSLLLYLAPDLVEMSRARDNMVAREELRRYRRGNAVSKRRAGGSVGLPTLASAEKGRLLFERIRSRISDRIFLAPSLEE